MIEPTVKFEHKECSECKKQTLLTEFDGFYTEFCKECVKESQTKSTSEFTCELCKVVISGKAFIHDNKIWHAELEVPFNCIQVHTMKSQGYSFPCPVCECSGRHPAGWNMFGECFLCLGQGFLKKEPVFENGIYKRGK